MPLPLVGEVQAVPCFNLSGLGRGDPCIYPPSNLVEKKKGKFFALMKFTPIYGDGRY
jgi:hypothetical protein